MAERFEGFPKDFFAFFRELKSHNECGWFEANKPRFRDSVQAPMSAFIAAMAPHLRRVSKRFSADPRPNGGSLFRIYRDVRFAKEKRKSFYAMQHGSLKLAQSPQLVEEIAGAFTALAPLIRFLCTALEVPF